MKGQGAFQRGLDGVDTPIRAAEFGMSDSGLTVVGSISHLTPETKALIAEFNNPTFMQLGSSLKLLMVAEGSAHCYPRLAPTCEWDTAASQVIMRSTWADQMLRLEPTRFHFSAFSWAHA